MRSGFARGFSVPRITIEGRDASIASFITATAEENAFLTAFKAMPPAISAPVQTQLWAEAVAALGPKFDQRKFHDLILSLGSVPLPILEDRINRFIADES